MEHRDRYQQGITMTEIMVVVGVIGLMAALAQPALQDLMADQRVKKAIRGAADAFSVGRSEAIRTGNNVFVVMIDANGGADPTPDELSQVGGVDIETYARCQLGALPGGDVLDALAAFAEHRDRLGATYVLHCSLVLWEATGDRSHLERARVQLDETASKMDGEARESFLTNLTMSRRVLSAWREEFGSES